MILKPDPSTFAILPDYFDKDHHNYNNTYRSTAARMFVDIYEGFNGIVTLEILDLLHRNACCKG
jgi:hypothetical protein